MKRLLFILPVALLLFSCTQPGDETNLDPVSISNFTNSATSADSLSFTWQTDVASDCTLHYGPYQFYGLTSDATADADQLNHSITINGLRPHTDYDMYVRATPSSPDYADTNSSNYEYSTQTYPRGTFVSSGWEPVGALCFKDSNGYYGPYSTAVLIDYEWVLTAAHCLEVIDSYYGVVPDTTNTVFYIGGEDASPSNTLGEPTEGSLYGIDQIVIHPNYSNGQDYDLALIHLSTPVTGITPASINTTAMSSADIGNSIDTVGFDASLTSVKKEQGQSIGGVDNLSFYTPQPPNHQSLLGCSGIVAFDASDSSKVLGIVIETVPESDDPFLGYAIFTRVDYHSPWINGVVNR